MPPPSGNLNPTPPSLEKRLPIALALMMLVLLASQYFFKPAPGPKNAPPTNTKTAQTVTAKPSASATSQVSEDTSAPGQVQAGTEMLTEVDTNLYHVVFTNRGAAVKSWVLKKYQDSTSKPQQLINPEALGSLPLPFTIEPKDQQLTVDPNKVLYRVNVSGNGTDVEYEYSDGKTDIRKSFKFGVNSYLSEVKSTVTLNGMTVPHFLVWRGGFGDQKVKAAALQQHTVRYDTSAQKLQTKVAKDAKNGPVTDSGNYTFAGLEDSFFAAVALPEGTQTEEVRTFSDELKVPGEDKPQPHVGAGIASGAQNQFSLYVGPKDVDILRAVSPKLEQLVDWGFWGLLAKPLFLSLLWVHDHWTNNFGWAIICVTLIINLLLFPFKLTSLKSARRMQKLQPQIQAINAKYKDVGLRDPRKAEQNQEVMDLYKKEGVNPVGGCLPLIIQLPFFYAFYRVLNIAIELRHASWMWVPDLSSAETLPIHLLPILLIATQFLQQQMTPQAGVDPNQARMMKFMPLMFGFMFYSASAGLVLYWLTSNVMGIGQQFLINKMMPTPPAPPAPVASSKAPVKRTAKR